MCCRFRVFVSLTCMLVFPLPAPPDRRPLPPASSTALLPCALARPPLLLRSPW